MRLVLIILSLFAFLGLTQTSFANTLDEIRKRDALTCGVDEQHFGFAYLDEKGEWTGFEVEFCRALATAVLGDATKVRFIPLNAQTRFTALKNRDVDVLFRSTTWTYSRDASYGFDFPGVTFYDHLGILAHKSIGVQSLDEVIEGTLCVADGTTTLETVREYVRNTGKPISIKVFNSREGLNNFFFSGQCNLYAADHSALTAVVAVNAPNPADYVYLKANLSKEPLGPVVRGDDGEWYDIVKWLVFGLIEAEERGISKSSVDAMLHSNVSAVQFMLGVKPGFGMPLRLDDLWLRNVVKQFGNYGDIFEKYLGQQSTLKMERGLNNLWKNGGLMYSMPIR